MARILFVDDEPGFLDGLRRMLHPFRAEWQTCFATSGAEALRLLAETPFDALVTGLKMPGMDGAELLARVSKSYPEVTRIVLSGQADRELHYRCAEHAHQFLSKPCDAGTLESTLRRVLTLREFLTGPALRSAVASLHNLPSIPAVYQELILSLRRPEVSVPQIANLISRDMAMSAKVLQLVNSAFFGLRRHIENPVDAAFYLGLDTITALALSLGLFSQFDVSALHEFSIERLWNHSLATASLAQKIALAEGASKKACETALVAGMLHDVGKLVFAAARPESYAKVLRLIRTEALTDCAAERRVLGASHAQVGGYLFRLWGLPDGIVEAVAFHHDPSAFGAFEFDVITAVHVADALDYRRNAKVGAPASAVLDLDFLRLAGLTARLPDWQALAGLSAPESTAAPVFQA